MKKHNTLIRCLSIIALCFSIVACESFVDTEVPDFKISSENVFSNDEAALSAMNGVYNELFRSSFSSGGRNSITLVAGLSGNNLQTEVLNDNLISFEEYEVSPNNSYNLNIWSSTYNMIYMVNAMIEGVNTSSGLTVNTKNELLGQALFVRAFSYFYLTNLYKEVPLILTTDYRENATAFPTSRDGIYDQIIEDLERATSLLDSSYLDGDRTRPNLYAAHALLARVNLYMGQLEDAALNSELVIGQINSYNLLQDLNQVFLPDSREAIWQISPIGSSSGLVHTNEGNVFIKADNSTSSVPVSITEDLLKKFAPGDKRYENWINNYSQESDTVFFPFKYKVQYANSGAIPEYSMVLRLAEQYLIHAEASARTGSLEEAINSLDIIRTRAGLNPIAELNPQINQQALLDSIGLEKRREFFTEWGHQWLDLKRLEKADEVFSENEYWERTDILYPIPEEELLKDPNLTQNPGY